MKQIALSAFIVIALIIFDATISVSYAKTKITIFKVTKVSPKSKLHIRAWPSPKSRVKKSLPYNAKDLTETGKTRIIGKAKWVEVNWKNTRGWVNGRYLKKTGVLLHAKNQTKQVVARTSRNTQSKKKVASKQPAPIQPVITPSANEEIPPQILSGDRYDQPTQIAATELKTSYSAKKVNKILNCSGKTPNPWNIKLNMSKKRMSVRLNRKNTFNVPIKYHDWTSPTRVRMNLGGSRGRNIVDVNLEKTDACSNGLSRTNFTYEINATINKQFYSGCCGVVSN